MIDFPIIKWCEENQWTYGIYDLLDPTWNFKKDVKTNCLGTFLEGIDKYNKLKIAVIDWAEENHIPKINWTEHGYISKKTSWQNIYSYDIRETKALAEIIILSTGYILRVCIGRSKEDSMSGSKALYLLKRELQKDGHNIDDYVCTNYEEAKEIKDNMPSPKIELTDMGKWLYKTDIQVNHIDLNSAYSSGIIAAYPELTDTYTRLYNKRKENPVYKDVLNMSIGMMHSDALHYKYVKLANAAYTHCLKELDRLTTEMSKNKDITIINYNTDGIWYMGPVYHDEKEGTGLGQWKNDYINVTASFKKARSYEFTEQDGTFHVAQSGYTSLDNEKSRDKWVKGDIYKAQEYQLKKTLDKYMTYYWERVND